MHGSLFATDSSYIINRDRIFMLKLSAKYDIFMLKNMAKYVKFYVKNREIFFYIFFSSKKFDKVKV